MGLGAGARAAETWYSEPKPVLFKTFDQFLYDILLTKFCRKIFCYIRSLSDNHLPTIFPRTIILFTIFDLRSFVSYDL